MQVLWYLSGIEIRSLLLKQTLFFITHDIILIYYYLGARKKYVLIITSLTEAIPIAIIKNQTTPCLLVIV